MMVNEFWKNLSDFEVAVSFWSDYSKDNDSSNVNCINNEI